MATPLIALTVDEARHVLAAALHGGPAACALRLDRTDRPAVRTTVRLAALVAEAQAAPQLRRGSSPHQEVAAS